MTVFWTSPQPMLAYKMLIEVLKRKNVALTRVPDVKMYKMTTILATDTDEIEDWRTQEDRISHWTYDLQF